MKIINMSTFKTYNLEKIEDGKTIIYEFDCDSRISYEVSQLDSMTDQEVCKAYNVDSRSQAVEGITEYWKHIY